MEIRYRQTPPRRLETRAFIPLLAALAWVGGGEGEDWRWWLFALAPLAYLITAAVALLAKVHDVRIHQLHAAGGALGTLLALPALLLGGGWHAVLAGALSLWSFLAAGRIAVAYEPRYEGADEPLAAAPVDAKAAVDETLLAFFVGVAKIPAGAAAEAMCLEALRLEQVLDEHGWIAKPASFHTKPAAPTSVISDAGRWMGVDFERVSYPSGFQPHPELPSAAAYSSHLPNQRAQLRVFRHPGAPRPWLLCIHGYRMGVDWMDFGLFNPLWLHRKLGLNLLMPVLPLHGPRRIGWQSGDDYLDGNILELLHAKSHALWDLRRAIAWLRDREPDARVGAYGISLGGYNAALLASYEEQLDFVLAGIPLVDAAAALWRFLPDVHKRFYQQHGMSQARFTRILTPVSPLARPALLAREGRHIFAAVADRLVIPDQPLALAAHWQVPVRWYQGAHLSVTRERITRQTMDLALRSAGWK